MPGPPNGVGRGQVRGSDNDGDPLVDGRDGGVDHGVEFALLEIGGFAGAAQWRDGVDPVLDEPGHQFGEPIGVHGVIGKEGGDGVGDDSVKLWRGCHAVFLRVAG